MRTHVNYLEFQNSRILWRGRIFIGECSRFILIFPLRRELYLEISCKLYNNFISDFVFVPVILGICIVTMVYCILYGECL